MQGETVSACSQLTNENSEIESEYIKQLKQLLVRTQTFNSHFSVFKKILNLREPSSDFIYVSSQAKGLTDCQVDGLKDVIATLDNELASCHSLGVCLAYNVQDLHKKLNGIPLDTTATDGIVQGLMAKCKSSRNSETELRFEFEEKRKLLRRLRQQLEQARRDWNNLKIRVQEPDSAVNSSDSESISDDRSQRLTRLEEQANQLVTRMRRPLVESLSVEADTDDDVVLEEEEEEEEEQDEAEVESNRDEEYEERAASSQLTIVTPEVEPIETEEEEEPLETRELRRTESIAETGEPAVLCRLRRKAVEVLVSRLKEERGFHETREKELKARLEQAKKSKKQLGTLCAVGWTLALVTTGITIWTLL